MAFFSKISKSADLMFGLTERMDVDLGTRVLENPEQAAQEYRAMVMRCTGCSNPGGCAKLQRTQEHIKEAPEYCMNRDTLNAMRVG
ncbi:MAG: DUF6455 family protein [Sulfitobacter sp.]